MGLNDCTVGAAIAVTDMGKATEFYEGKLGLKGGEDPGDGGKTYACAGSTRLHVFPSAQAGGTGATVAGFSAGSNFDSLVDELTSNGVTFEQYDEGPIKTDERGVGEIGGIKLAWFKDPDGNTLGITSDD